MVEIAQSQYIGRLLDVLVAMQRQRRPRSQRCLSITVDCQWYDREEYQQSGSTTGQKSNTERSNGQDLGAMGALLVRSFTGISKFSPQRWLHETMPSEWNATQSEGIHVHIESTPEFFHTTKRRRKSNDVT